MRRRVVCLFLCAALLLGFSLLPGQALAAANVFVAINDTLPGVKAFASGGVYYVPYSVFSSFGVYYSPVDSSTALLYSGTTAKYIFDLQNGGCKDENGNSYPASAILRGGTVYVPAAFVSGCFGLQCTYIDGNEYGDILRIKNSAAVLNDKRFLEAASTLMRDYAGGDSPSAPPPTPTATPKPSPGPTPNKSAVRVRLCFEGLPDSDTLDLLSGNSIRACFFVTADDARQNADELRRAAGSGQKLGVLLDPGDCAGSFSETSELLFEAAHIGTVLCAAPASGAAGEDAEAVCSAFAKAQGLCFVAGDLSLSTDLKAVTASLSGRTTGSADIRVIYGGGGAALLKDLITYLKANQFDVEPMLEVG